MADTDVQGMLVRIEATTAQLRQEMARADSSVGQASGKIDKSLGRIDTAFDRAGERALNASGLIKTALAGAIGAAGLGKIIEAADSYGQMSDRIGMATSSVSEYDLVQQRLLDTAKRTYRPLAEAQELYIRTSDSLKSMGYNTSQALDVMDSFSFLLVTNSASADKASGAIDSYSKALQTGKVEADGWQSIIAAMPTVVDTLAKATGKSAEEIRSLGANGKLGLDLLTEGLRKSAEANGNLADLMTIAVRDAMQNLSNSFGVYVGRLDETTNFTGVLGKAITLVGDNFETLADVSIIAAVAALSRYAATATFSGAAAVYSALKDAAARKAQATAVLLVAQAEQQKAQTSVFLAEKEAIAARGTAVQTQMSLQLAEARLFETRATNAVAVAQAGVGRAGVGLVGMMGGPLGVAALAIGAATAFLTLRDNSGMLESKLGDLSGPVDELTKKFNELGRASQAVTLRELRAEIVKTEQQVRESSESIADQFESTLRNAGAAGQDAGLAAGFVDLSGDAKAAFDIVKKASEESAKGAAVDWADVANKVRAYPSAVSESMAQDIEKNAGNVEKFVKTLSNQQAILKATTTDTAADTEARGKNTAAAAEATAAGEKYLEQLNKQLGTLEDKTAAEAAERVILEQKIDTESAVAASIRARAKAIDQRKAADEAAAKAERKSTSESASAAKQQLKSFDTAEEGYQRQIELLNTTGDKQKDATEVMKLSFEMQEGKLGKLSEAQKKKLMGMAAELDSLNKLKKANEDDLKLTAFKNSQALNTQTTKDGFDQELAGVGMGDKARDRMRADLAMRQKYAAEVASLNEQRNTGQITPELYADETQVLQDELNKRLLAQENYYAAIDEQQTNWMNGVNEAWANYANAARDYSAQAADVTNTALSEGTSGLGTFFADVASGAEDAGDALGDMVGNFAKSMLKALADMAAQWLIYQGVQLLVGKGTQASSAVMLGANAQAMSLQAGLNAYASTAAIPIIGPAAAPAAMAAALTVTQPLASAVGMTALAGMAHDGIDAVPEDGSWFLQKGERVTTAQTSAKLDAMLSRIDNNLMNSQPQAQIGVGSLESAGNGRAALVGSSAESTSSGPSQIIFSAPVTVQAQQGMSSQDAQMQGDSIGAALEARMGKFLDAEMRQGGRLWRR